MDESPDHEPTLIEWSMGVHLNHLITAQRETHNSRPARWELWMPHPFVPRRDGEGAYKQDGGHPSIASTGPRLRGSTHGYTSWKCTERRRVPNTCAWHRRGRLKHCRCWLKLKPRTLADSANKTFQEHPRSCEASEATPAGAVARPHGAAQRPGGKNFTSASISLCRFLTDTTREARELLSGTAMGVP
jgi:hypothetical protein